jgi:hypothetical protein
MAVGLITALRAVRPVVDAYEKGAWFARKGLCVRAYRGGLVEWMSSGGRIPTAA